MNNQIVSTGMTVLLLMGFQAACSVDTKEPVPELKSEQTASSAPGRMQPSDYAEGSTTQQPMPSEVMRKAEGSASDVDGHPVLDSGQPTIERNIIVPASVDGKWKSVKILVRSKKDEEGSHMQTVDLGSTFSIEGTDLHVTVGPFLPNFVMDTKSYTSNGNELSNPAVHLVVKEGDTRLFKGWAFAKFPGMYAFEHEAWSLQLMDFIPVDVS